MAELGTHAGLSAQDLTRRARASGFRGGIVAAVVASVLGGLILSGINAVFPSVWDWIWTPRVPSGAIMPFDRLELRSDNSCPKGWSPYDRLQGRVIIGAATDQPNGLTSRAYRDEGGREKVTLTEKELPAHSHEVYFVPDRENLANGNYNLIRDVISVDPKDPNQKAPGKANTTKAGEGQAFDIMPPFRALYYCIKD